MGPIEINAAEPPQKQRRVAFTGPEVTRLVQEIKQRKDIIFGTKDQPPQPHQVRQAWEDIAEIISSLSSIKRSGEQCRKRFNDIKRRGQMMVAGKKRGRPPKNRPKVGDIREIMEYKKHVEPEDLEFEVQAPMDDDDPDYEPSPKRRESVKVVTPKESPKSTQIDPPAAASYSPSPMPPTPSQPMPSTPSQPKPPTPSQPKPQTPSLPKPQTPSLPKPQTPSQPKPQTPSQPKPQTPSQPKPQNPSISKPQNPSLSKPQNPSLSKPQNPSLPRPKVVVVRRPAGSTDPMGKQEDDKHPFLELQQAGFDMLKRELSGFRDSVMSLNTRLNHLEVALRPIGGIADSLSRIATAVERFTSPPE